MNSSRRDLLRLAESWFVVGALLFFMGAMFPLLSSDGGSTASLTAGSARFQITSMGLYLVALTLVFARLQHFLTLCRQNIALILLVVFALLSTVWSVEPDVTLRRGIALAFTTVFAIYLVMRFPPDELLELLGWALAIAAFASLVYVLAWPGLGIDYRGNWQGTFDFKNRFGRVMALGVLVFFVLATSGQQRTAKRQVVWLGLVLCSGMLIMSQARTAWVTTAAVLVLVPFLRFLQKSRYTLGTRFAVVVILGLCGLGLALGFVEQGLELLGRKPTLSGRTYIWEVAISVGMEQPWLGKGYRAFWTETGASKFFANFYAWEANFGHGHNGYVDVWLELGFVGLAILVTTMIIAIVRVVWWLTRVQDPFWLWSSMFLVYILLFNITEKAIMQQGDVEWIFYVTTLFYSRLRNTQSQSIGPKSTIAQVSHS